MNVSGSSSRSTPTLKKEGISRSLGSSSSGIGSRNDVASLNFYAEPPYFELSLDEFEEFALARLKVLRKIEELKTRNITGEAFKKALDQTIQENLDPSSLLQSNNLNAAGNNAMKLNSKEEAKEARRRMDLASHFILRAAYCKTEELRRWFLSQETFLFKYQLEKIANSSSLALETFLQENHLNFDIVPKEEKKQYASLLLDIPTGNHSSNKDYNSNNKVPSLSDILNTLYFKIPFQEATDLIATRQCLVRNGFAYVPLTKIVSIVTSKFRASLSKSLAQASRLFSSVMSSTADYAPILPLLNSMNSQYTGGKEYNDASQTGIGGDYELTHSNVYSYASSMPLCMQMLHEGLMRDHKLKHNGRLQYGLFLKGAGMSMEESLMFFQREFTKIMTSEKFQKEYTYNIRHSYGKEGKRTNYTPYSCAKIILGTPPNNGEHHGCPYRHYDDDHLASVLSKMQIGSVGDRNEIMTLKRNKHYNLACQKHFEVMHPNAASVKDLNLSGVGDHPNAWYAASVAYRMAKGDGKEGEDAK